MLPKKLVILALRPIGIAVRGEINPRWQSFSTSHPKSFTSFKCLDYPFHQEYECALTL